MQNVIYFCVNLQLPITCMHSRAKYENITVFCNYVITLDSGINVAPGINVAHGTFGKNIKRSP
jgi:hypothetical protein